MLFTEVMIPVGNNIIINGLKCESVTLAELISKADVISVHVPKTSQTENMINHNFLQKLKKNCILINTSRGELVNEKELVEFLKQNKDFKYGTDVIKNEPSFQKGKFENVYLGLSNVLQTCHIGASTKQAEFDIGNGIVENLTNFRKNGKFLFGVNNLEPKL